MTNPEHLANIRAFVDGILARDGHDFESAAAVKRKAAAAGKPAPGVEPLPTPAPQTESATFEAIISLHRPVLAIANDTVDTDITATMDDQAAAITKLVLQNKAGIDRIIPAIGRIDLPGDESLPWVGTGWIVDSALGDDIIITNAHVAEYFAAASGAGFVFSPLPFLDNRKEAPLIDFRHEIAATPPRRFDVTGVIYIGTPGFLDIAFLRVARNGADRLAPPIRLASSDPAPNLAVATIGYPGTDRGDYDVETLLRMFGNVFDTKRLSPGRITGPDAMGLAHDCSTMPGSSGSILFDLATAEAVGLHFQGVPFKSNHAVPNSVIRKLIKDLAAGALPGGPPRVGGAGRPELQQTPPEGGAMKPVTGDRMQLSATLDADGVKLVVPLEITLRLGTPMRLTAAPGSGSGLAPNYDRATAEAAAGIAKQRVQTNRNVVGVRASYLFKDGLLSDEIGVIVKVRPEASRDPKDYGLDAAIGGVAVAIEMADLESLAGLLAPGALEAPAQMQNYKRDLSDSRFKLDPVTDTMTLTLHVSPEAGWRELAKFFTGTGYNQITIGMYNFTAPHIIAAVRAAIHPSARHMTLTLDRKTDDVTGSKTKAQDWHEDKVVKTLASDAGNRFEWTPASVSGPKRLFATSYHIKVAVLSQGTGANASKRFWLSSGNWASSNQAPLDDQNHPLATLTWSDVKDYDRDWHAIVENGKLASTLRNHLAQDYVDSAALAGVEAAAPIPPDLLVPEEYFLEAPRVMKDYKPFPPKIVKARVTVQPVLTPDNYPEIVTPFIAGATQSVLFINQSFDINPDSSQIPPHYLGLLKALLQQQKAGRDVRIIFRSGYGKERDIYRNAVEFGFDKSRIRFFSTCHTKGIVVDKKRVLLGSQNWTGAGTKFNRDASLLIDNADAAAYFADIFEFDWAKIATDKVPPDPAPTRPARASAGDEEAVLPAGFRVVPWNAWSGS